MTTDTMISPESESSMKRKIVHIDEQLCDGCGNCVVSCAEGAIRIIDGKAKLVKEQFCDGFGDCVGECPLGAMQIEEMEADAFDPQATKEHLMQTQGPKAVRRMEQASRRHAKQPIVPRPQPGGCPGAKAFQFNSPAVEQKTSPEAGEVPSQLRHWPIQMSLVSPQMPVLKNADLLLAADCTAFAYGDFHRRFIAGKVVIIGCPKLDQTEPYLEKLTEIIKTNDLKSLTVAHMEVPCCHGLANLAQEAIERAGSNLRLVTAVLGVQGDLRT